MRLGWSTDIIFASIHQIVTKVSLCKKSGSREMEHIKKYKFLKFGKVGFCFLIYFTFELQISYLQNALDLLEDQKDSFSSHLLHFSQNFRHWSCNTWSLSFERDTNLSLKTIWEYINYNKSSKFTNFCLCRKVV